MSLYITIFFVVVIFGALMIQSMLMKRRMPGHPLDIDPSSKQHPSNHETAEQVLRITGTDWDDLETVFRDFGESNGLSRFFDEITFTQVGDRSWVAALGETLPFDVFCYLVNYLEYPINKTWKATATGWTNFQSKEKSPLDSLPEPMMMYISEVDHSYDLVYITGASGIGYKCSFQKMVLEYIGDGGKMYQSPPLLP